MFRLRTARLSCALLALSMGPGFATIVTFSDLTAWQNATAAGFTTITFDNLGTPSGTPYTTGLVIGGTSFYGAANGTGQLWVYNQTQGPGNYNNYGSGSILVGPVYQGGSYVPYINITLPVAVTSVGFDIMTIGSGGISFTATINNATYTSAPTYAWSATSPQRQFFGFTSTPDNPISNFLLSLPTSAMYIYPALDNFSYGSAGSAPTETPEACTLLLIGAGLVGMRLFRRRLRKPAEAGRSAETPAVPYRRPFVTASLPTH